MPQALFGLSEQGLRFEGDSVIRTGKYFECGTEFTDMKGVSFSVSEAEADALLPKFSGGKLNLEHTPTILSGKLGEVRKLWRDGKDIMAEYVIPKWLHDVTAGEPIKISSEWNRKTKEPFGGAMVLKPAVQDAVMMAAFSQFEPAEFSRSMLQDHHDMAVRHGAECNGKAMFSESAEFMTPQQLKHVQHIHDYVKKAMPNCCDAYASRQSMYSYYSENKAQAHSRAGQEKQKMSLWDRIAAFRRAGVPEDDIRVEVGGEPVQFAPAVLQPAIKPDATETAEFKAISAEFDKAKAELAEARKAAQEAQFAQFSQSAKNFGKYLPAAEEAAKKLFAVAPAEFAAFLEANGEVVAMSEKQAERAAGTVDAREKRAEMEGGASNGADAEKLHKFTQARMKESGEPYHVAFSAVCRENKDLAASVRVGK